MLPHPNISLVPKFTKKNCVTHSRGLFLCFGGGLVNIPKSTLYNYQFLVGGLNPSEKYSSNWIISPRDGGRNKKSLKQPPSFVSGAWLESSA